MLEVAVGKPSANCFLEKRNKQRKKSNKRRFLVKSVLCELFFYQSRFFFPSVPIQGD